MPPQTTQRMGSASHVCEADTFGDEHPGLAYVRTNVVMLTPTTIALVLVTLATLVATAYLAVDSKL